MTNPATVGITGVAGFIGSHLAERLLAEGRSVVGIDDFSHGSPSNMDTFRDDPNFTFWSSTAATRCASAAPSATATRSCTSPPRRSRATAGRSRRSRPTSPAPSRCTRPRWRSTCTVLVASTSDVYGNATPPFAEDADLTLGPPTTRRWAYATSKLYDEHVALAMAEEQGLKVTILRFFGSYGPRNNPIVVGRPAGRVLRDPARRQDDGDPRRRPPDAHVHLRDGHGGRRGPRAGRAEAARRDHQHRRRRADTIDRLAHECRRRSGSPGRCARRWCPTRHRRQVPGRARPHPRHHQGRRGCSASARPSGSPRAWPLPLTGTRRAAPSSRSLASRSVGRVVTRCPTRCPCRTLRKYHEALRPPSWRRPLAVVIVATVAHSAPLAPAGVLIHRAVTRGGSRLEGLLALRPTRSTGGRLRARSRPRSAPRPGRPTPTRRPSTGRPRYNYVSARAVAATHRRRCPRRSAGRESCSTGNTIVQENCHPGTTAWRATSTGTVSPLTATSRASPPTTASTPAARSTSRSTRPTATLPRRHLPHRLLRRQPGPHGLHDPEPLGRPSGQLPGRQPHPACWTARTGPRAPRSRPPSWPSGVYLLRMVRTDSGNDELHAPIVRDDVRDRPTPLRRPTSSYQAYNGYGGKSLYA